MNRRIKKKRRKLYELNASKWKYLRIVDRHCKWVEIETRHSIWTLMPHDESPWIRYLKLARTGRICESYRNKQCLKFFWENMNLRRNLYEQKNQKEN